MADEETSKQKEKKVKEPSTGFSVLTWVILGSITLAGIAGGFALAQLLAGPESTPQVIEQKAKSGGDFNILNVENDVIKPWIYNLEPVIANLDEPGVTRYIRITLSIELNPEVDQMLGEKFLEEKRGILVDWLTTYLAGLTLEQVRGTKNLSRIKKEIRDQFNLLLFPDTKPYVNRVLFKEFAVQ